MKNQYILQDENGDLFVMERDPTSIDLAGVSAGVCFIYLMKVIDGKLTLLHVNEDLSTQPVLKAKLISSKTTGLYHGLFSTT